MKKSKNNNIILGLSYWFYEFGFSWCKGKIIYRQKWPKIKNEKWDERKKRLFLKTSYGTSSSNEYLCTYYEVWRNNVFSIMILTEGRFGLSSLTEREMTNDNS